jgi:hypothetical protein
MLLIILHAINFFRIFEIVLSKYFIFFLVTSVQYHPGPAVTATTPTVPVILATASAAKTAET